jgi:hypothetical protein
MTSEQRSYRKSDRATSPRTLVEDNRDFIQAKAEHLAGFEVITHCRICGDH